MVNGIKMRKQKLIFVGYYIFIIYESFQKYHTIDEEFNIYWDVQWYEDEVTDVYIMFLKAIIGKKYSLSMLKGIKIALHKYYISLLRAIIFSFTLLIFRELLWH